MGMFKDKKENASEQEQKKEKNSEVADLEKKLEECQKLKDEYLSGWQRSRADLLNYKKEEMERIVELVAYAKEEIILKILPILDNLEIAEGKIPANLKEDENVKGLLLIKDQFKDFLKNFGMEEIKSVGEQFDPNWHEVVGEAEDKETKPGTIVEELRKGYKVNGRLVRPAKVKVVK